MTDPRSREDDWQAEVRAKARGIRCRVLEHALAHGGGYVSQACSSAEVLAALYLRLLRLGPVPRPLLPAPFAGVPGPDNPLAFTGAAFHGPVGPGLDRFILSPSQYSLALYAALVEVGRMAPEGLDQFNQDGSTVEMIGAEHSPGMSVMTGSLGQGISQAAGIAWARRRKGETGRMWLFLSDGEFQIGQTWEAIQALAAFRLDAVKAVVDVNGQQCDGPTAAVMPVEPLDRRLEAFGACVRTVDGHDVAALVAAAEEPHPGKPLVVLAYTDPARGLEVLRERAPKFHYLRFTGEAEKARYAAGLADLRARKAD
jgi:transketolase